MFEIEVSGEFEAAHRIAGYPGKCDRLHGHSWRVDLVVEGAKLDGLGMLVDFKLAKAELERALERLDHRYLNELEPFSGGQNPTAENLALHVYEELARSPLFSGDARLSAVRVWESPHSCATYRRGDAP